MACGTESKKKNKPKNQTGVAADRDSTVRKG